MNKFISINQSPILLNSESDEIEKLFNLKEKGIIPEEEFIQKKQKILE